MAATSQFQNVYHLRTVAEASSKPCFICYKPTAAVLTTLDNKDFFYVCRTHLTDRGFASPIVDKEVEEAKKKKEAMDREIEKVKKEYEEKMKAKKARKKTKDDEKDKSKDDKAKEEDVEKERDEKIKAIQSGQSQTTADDGPRIFALHRNIYQMRIDRLRSIETAKRQQQRLKDPHFFPAAPKGDIG